MDNNTILISTSALQLFIDKKISNLFIFDCSWLDLPVFGGRNALSEFNNVRIPTSEFFDLNECRDKDTDLPHMLPCMNQFTTYIQSKVSNKLSNNTNILQDDTVIDLKKDIFVFYDSLGIWSSPRVWWMFKIFGTEHAYILDGGLPKWLSEQRFVDQSLPMTSNNLKYLKLKGLSFNSNCITSLQEIQQIVCDTPATTIVVDARPTGRFQGNMPEPRPDIPSGHIPGSINVPWTAVLNAYELNHDHHYFGKELTLNNVIQQPYTYYAYKSSDELIKLFQLILPNSLKQLQIIFSCGSGVSAAVILVAYLLHLETQYEKNHTGTDGPSTMNICELLCNHTISLYDGSWTEWKLAELKRL